jgi:hypothetical protein
MRLYRPHPVDIDRGSTAKDLLSLQDFHLLGGRSAVDAVGILASLIDGL